MRLEKLKIQVFESFSNDLEDQWKKIEKNSNFNPFLSYEWIKLWQSEIGSKLLKVKPKIILIENKQNEKAIFPFCIKHQNSIKICEWMGDINSDYMGFISTRKFNLGESKFQEILEVILERIGNIDVLYLKNQLPKINDFANPFYNLRSIYKKKAYLSFLNKNWEEYYKFHQNSKSRETYRRKLKKIQKIGSLSFIVAKTEEQKLKIIKQMIELKKKDICQLVHGICFQKKNIKIFI